MSLRNTSSAYGSVAKSFHWLLAALMIAVVIYAWSFDDMPAGPEKFSLITTHKAIGVTILALVILRLLWRQLNPVPALPKTMSRSQVWLAQGVHGLLYFVMFAMPVSGLIMSLGSGHAVNYFGLFTLPAFSATPTPLSGIAYTLHVSGQFAFYAAFALHVAGALYHHFILKDDILLRMAPCHASKKSTAAPTS